MPLQYTVDSVSNEASEPVTHLRCSTPHQVRNDAQIMSQINLRRKDEHRTLPCEISDVLITDLHNVIVKLMRARTHACLSAVFY